MALFVAGAGWHWPPGSDLVAGTWSILRGDTLAGLEPDATTDPGALMWIIAALICGAVIAATVWAMCRHLAATRHRGMARAPEAAKLLGTARLRSHRAVIRPDLYAKGPR
ncbi:hypothetical protein [Tessaracoccus sp. MC1756]|uniref:hypothetical protein n=1 Tax=Tessaracoccus sp. MC1756 TaxID=2760311 RepID=UPI001600CF06|nr:hypothetical protein [Tessaracoccus sp. MC1756]MBB1510641.1 hypothetical protein [Tessaracoccus sp. MC1756]